MVVDFVFRLVKDTIMKARLAVILAVVVIGVGIIGTQIGFVSPALAGDGLAAATAVTILPGGTDEGTDEAKFVGNKKCKMCHKKEYESWLETKKAKTFDPLKPGQASEAKQKHNLDPAKDYTKDEGCLACHATGYGKPGGYFNPDPNDEKAVKNAKKLEGVGCESCHGPGGEYTKLHKEIKKSKRTYKDEEMYAAGLKKIEEATCVRCHNDKSPTYQPFDYEKQKEEGLHEVLPLKQREEE